MSLNLYYNVFGPRIREVGLGGLPDTLEEPFHSLDVSAGWRFKEQWKLGVNMTNLLMQSVLITQGGELAQRAERGLSAGVKLSYEH